MAVDVAHPPLLNPPAGGLASAQPETVFGDNGQDDDDDKSDDDDDDDDGENDNDDGNIHRNRKNDNNNDVDDADDSKNIMCRKGTFRGSVFFVAEGQGEVVFGGHEREVFHGGQAGGGGSGGDFGGGCGSSTESLLAAAAFADTRANRNRRKARRRRDSKVGARSGRGPGRGGDVADSNSTQLDRHRDCGAYVNYATTPAVVKGSGKERAGAGARTAAASGAAGGKQKEKEASTMSPDGAGPAAGGNPTELVLDVPHGHQQRVTGPSPPTSPAAMLAISFSEGERERSGWEDSWDSGGEERRWPRKTFLNCGDFFGVDPVSPIAVGATDIEQVRSEVTVHLLPPCYFVGPVTVRAT